MLDWWALWGHGQLGPSPISELGRSGLWLVHLILTIAQATNDLIASSKQVPLRHVPSRPTPNLNLQGWSCPSSRSRRQKKTTTFGNIHNRANMSSNGDATLPATRRSRKSISGRLPSQKNGEKENATVDLGSTMAGSRKKLRSKSMGPGSLDILQSGAGNRRAVCAPVNLCAATV